MDETMDNAAGSFKPPIASEQQKLNPAALYEGDGIRLYEEITRSDGYYLYREEISILHDNKTVIHAYGLGQFIVSVIALVGHRYGSRVDLQHDDLRMRLENAVKSKSFLSSGDSEPQTASSGPKIDVHGVCASYLDALEALNFRFSQAPAFNSGETEHRKCLLWLGSSFTNFEPGEAVALLRSFVYTAELKSSDCILIGIDCCQDPSRLSAAYGSQSAQWRKYAQNGIRNAANILGNEAFIKMQSAGEWEYVARWDALRKRHVRFIKAPRNMSFDVAVDHCSKSKCSIKICKGEHIFLSQSYKYDHSELEMLFRDAGLIVSKEWSNEREDSLLFLLRKM
ncbi:hypothetical protein AC579_4536 [Pseudocercospora musae]|uniref:Histidine-specific methyltransferase SAM-dependent domain-containing protein n=1 Tax=Pseudocercospora musae TaxID=113226 RepID=A0A139ITN4_9PEZI|nr:hypothetical protein AC579_4536 [Pseudocercospora musae]